MRELKGLNPGFKELRCSKGAGKEEGRCEHTKPWDRRGIPDLRPGKALGAWVAVVGLHKICKRAGDKVKTLHVGDLLPWEGKAATGRSLVGAEGVDYLTEGQARDAVKRHNAQYKEWLKNNPNNN